MSKAKGGRSGSGEAKKVERATPPDVVGASEDLLLGAAEEEHPELLGAPQVGDLEEVLQMPVQPADPEPPPPLPKEPVVVKEAVVKEPEAVVKEPAIPQPKAIPAFPSLPKGSPRGLEDLPANATIIAPVLGPVLSPGDTPLPASKTTFTPSGRDFSLWQAPEAGEEFPTNRQMVQALVWSLGLGVVGFGLSYLLFVKHQTINNVPKIDRRAAETAPPMAYRDTGGTVSIVFTGYAASGLSKAPKSEGVEFKLKAPKVDAQPVAAPTPTPTANPTAVVKVDDDSAYPGGGGKHVVVHRPSAAQTPVATAAAGRPGSKGWLSAWQEARDAIVRFYSVDGPSAGGVVVTREGLVLTCLSRLNPDALSRIMTKQGIVSGQIVARDAENDLALVQLPPGEYPFLPLCPDAPRTGEWTIMPNASDPTRNCQQQCCGVSGSAFRVRGASLAGSWGWPLINDRAEVVGIYLGHPWLLQINQGAAISGVAAQRLVQGGGKNSPSGSPKNTNDFFSDFLRGVSIISSRARPTTSNNKVVPGEALGNYPLGMSRKLLTSELGPPTRADDQDGITRAEFNTYRIVCFIAHDTVVGVETEYSFYTAGRGLAVGSRADSSLFASEFPGSVWVELGGYALGVAPGIEVECQSGKISKIRVVPK